MAINSNEKLSDNNTPTSTTKSSCSKSSNLSSCRLMTIDYAADGSITSSNSKHDESKKKKNTSPYLTEDRIQLLSRITEKRLVRKQTTDFVSSFPLAVNIYKASSDEFKKSSKRSNKKVKKSVLTLPNEQAPLPQACTVSDMNDSEYFSEIKDERKPKPKKRRVQAIRKPSIKTKGMEVVDRDARYCSQLNIDLDSSSTDIINQFPGDGKKISKKRKTILPNNSAMKAHDVWAMLRNMNRFQFRPSPPMSQDSVESIKKTKSHNKRRNSKMDTKFIETCRTEQFTYFSSLVDKTPHNSQSSIDRITVIDKQDDYQDTCEDLKVKNKIPPKDKIQKKIKTCTKNKLNARAQQNNTKELRDDRDEVLHHTELRMFGNNLCKSQNKVQGQENKSILSNSVSYHPNSECSNKCLNWQNNINLTLKNDNACNNYDDDYVLYGNSEPSNEDISKNLSSMTDENKFHKLSPSESQWQINGITKVVLSKGQNILAAKKVESQKRKLRLVTTMPSAAVNNKLTQTEIKRRLAKIKFPLVILAKDEVSSTFKVANHEPLQFAGLDEHMWPFMQNWHNQDYKEGYINYKSEDKCIYDKTTQGMKGDCLEEYKNDIKSNKSVTYRNNNISCKSKRKIPLALKDKSVIQPVSKVETINIKATKTKPMRQFKDRMLHFLYKKPPLEDGNNIMKDTHNGTQRRDVPISCINIGTNTQSHLVFLKEENELAFKKEDKAPKLISSTLKQPWAKGRWASDFIDNVIKKIKSGVYYNQEEACFSRNQNCITKDNSVQTEMDYVKNDSCINCDWKKNSTLTINNKCDTLESIPGFEDNLSDLQIESVNKKQIAIKHCINNVIVQFDVLLPSEMNRMLHVKQSISCIPVTVTENQTKVYKSKQMIFNAMLPAELCSILPNMMRKIIDMRLVSPKIVDKVESHLFPIVELSRCESGDSIKHLIPIRIELSPVLKILHHGKFSNNVFAKTSKELTEKLYRDSKKELNLLTIADVLPNMNTNILLNCQIDPFSLHIFESQRMTKQLPKKYIKNTLVKASPCMEIQPCSIYKRQIAVPAFNNFIDIVAGILRNKNFTLNINTPLINTISAICYKNNVSVHLGLNADQNNINCVISDMNLDSLYKGFQGSFKDKNYKMKKTVPRIEECADPLRLKKIENYRVGVEYCVNNKTKKKSFIKLYKKCKSMSSISNEKSSSALSKIKSLDDFFQALGTAKTLASVFDETAENKILTSLKEMKNWIIDITPGQALLVLLLANKKDTLNLVRYRPVILQGIAVNRITRASELDMEIEVIERENLNIFSKYEGISYLPASVENQDSLLEELYWIAKTTASDYQRPFDESSERLLKSLLEKRKKLNPSYLRVMARYVGLGLVKSSK